MKPLAEMSPDEKTETVAGLWAEIMAVIVGAQKWTPSAQELEDNYWGVFSRLLNENIRLIIEEENDLSPKMGYDYCPSCGAVYDEPGQYGRDAWICAACHDKGIRESPIIAGLLEQWTRVTYTETLWGYLAEEIPIPAEMLVGPTHLRGIHACRSHRLVAYLREGWVMDDFDNPPELRPDIRVYCYTCKDQWF